jgi:DNA-binding MarR family transcriptional regulator
VAVVRSMKAQSRWVASRELILYGPFELPTRTPWPLIAGEAVIDLAALAQSWVTTVPSLRNMTLRQVALFGIVADADTIPSYSEMAIRLGSSKPVITRAFNTFSQLGLIVRSSDPTDRRKRVLSLTALGIETRKLMKTLAA